MLPSPIVDKLRPLIARRDPPVYYVGGVVRDALLGRAIHDIDLVVETAAIPLAFEIADWLDLPAYPLDKERDVGRIVGSSDQITLDIARFRGDDLKADLHGRDFTINAMALPAGAESLEDIIDPHNGRGDLAAGRLQMVHPGSIADDPVRALRAARLAVQLDFRLVDETATAARAAAPSIPARISAERIRDELIRLLDQEAAASGIRLLDDLGLLVVVLPEITALKGLEQSPPHHEPVYDHTLSTLRWLVAIERWLEEPDTADNPVALAGLNAVLAPYRPDLLVQLKQSIDGGLTVRQLLRWGTLLHDTGKALTQTVDPDGRIRFLGHDEAGAGLARKRLNALSFSNEAIRLVVDIVAGHMRPLFLATDKRRPSRRTIYRFFRAFPSGGVVIPLLALADHLATYDGVGEESSWQWLLTVVRNLYENYFTSYHETIRPARLLSGTDIMQIINLTGGPEVGRLLRLLEEAQAAGDITTTEQAVEFIHQQHRPQ